MEETVNISELDANAQKKARELKEAGQVVYAHKRRFWTVKGESDLPANTAHLYKKVAFD